MTLWNAIRGPLAAWLLFTGLVLIVIYDAESRIPVPKLQIPGCEMVEVKYKSPGGWTWTREEIQCPGPDGKVRVGW